MVRVVRELMRLVLRRMLMVLVLLVLMLELELLVLVLVLGLRMRVVRIRALRQVHRAGACAATTFAVSRPEEMASNSCVIPGRDLALPTSQRIEALALVHTRTRCCGVASRE